MSLLLCIHVHNVRGYKLHMYPIWEAECVKSHVMSYYSEKTCLLCSTRSIFSITLQSSSGRRHVEERKIASGSSFHAFSQMQSQ